MIGELLRRTKHWFGPAIYVEAGPLIPDPELIYLRIAPDGELPEIEKRHRRIVLVTEDAASVDWMAALADRIVRSGCHYVVAWGISCSEWEIAIDFAFLDMWHSEECPDEEFLMTTSHEEEGLADALWFARYCAFDSYRLFDECTILHVSDDDRGPQLIRLYETVEIGELRRYA